MSSSQATATTDGNAQRWKRAGGGARCRIAGCFLRPRVSGLWGRTFLMALFRPPGKGSAPQKARRPVRSGNFSPSQSPLTTQRPRTGWPTAVLTAGWAAANKEASEAKRATYAVRPRRRIVARCGPIAFASIHAGSLGGRPPKPPCESAAETLRTDLGAQFPHEFFGKSRFRRRFASRPSTQLAAIKPPPSPLRGVISRSGPRLPPPYIRRRPSRG